MVEYCHMKLTKRRFFLKKAFKIILSLSLLLNVILIAGGGYIAYKKGLIFKKNSTAYPINYVIQKNEYDSFKVNTNAIEFFGDSLTDYGQWSEFFNNSNIINRGIVGDDTERLRNRVNEIGTPSKLFVMAGINDLVEGKSVDTIVSNYDKLISTISKNSPHTKIFIESVLPISSDKYKVNYPSYKAINNIDILALNDRLKTATKKYNAIFIDLNPSFLKNGYMNPIYTVDGVHLTGEGYKVWVSNIRKYVES